MEPIEALGENVDLWAEHFHALRETVSGAFNGKPGLPASIYLLELVRDMAGVFAMLMDEKEHRDFYLEKIQLSPSWLRTYQPCPWDWETMAPALQEEKVSVFEGPRPSHRDEAVAWLALSKGLVWTTDGKKKGVSLLHGLDGLTPFPKGRPPYPSWEEMGPNMKPLLVHSTFLAHELGAALDLGSPEEGPWDFLSAASTYRFLLPQEVRIGGGFPVFRPSNLAPFDEDLAQLLGVESGAWSDLRLKGEIHGFPWEVSFGVICGGLELNLDTKQARWAFDVFITWGPMQTRESRAKAKKRREDALLDEVSLSVVEETKRQAMGWDEEDWTEWLGSILEAIQETLPRFQGQGAGLQAHRVVTSTAMATLSEGPDSCDATAMVGGVTGTATVGGVTISIEPVPGALTLTGYAPTLTITPRPVSIPTPQEPQEKAKGRTAFLPVTLPEGQTRMDRGAKRLLLGMADLDLPKDLMKAPAWDEMVEEEAGRIITEYREENRLIEEGNNLLERTEEPRPKKDPSQDPLLRVVRDDYGNESLVLSSKGRQALRQRAGAKGFREVKRDRDSLPMEWVVKHFKLPQGGYVETSLSWYSSALPFSTQARKKRGEELEAMLKAEAVKGTPLLFEVLEDHLQDKIQAEVGLLRNTIPDAQRLCDYILREFGRTGINPIRITSDSLRILLKAEMDPHGHSKVEAALKALTKLHFNLKITGDPELRGDTFGVFIGEATYEPGGGGGHGGGTWTIYISPNALGVLRVFQQTRMKKDGLRQIFYYDWMRDLDREEMEVLSDGWEKSPSTLIPFYDESHGFTDTQKRLIRFLESNTTMTQHGARTERAHLQVRKKKHPDHNKPRLYDSTFCPLIPKGVKLTGILGVKKDPRYAESGWRLQGTPGRATDTSGARAPSLLHAMGVEMPSGAHGNKRNSITKRAMEDLEAVVVQAMGGLVAVQRPKGAWITLDRAKLLPADTLAKDSFFFIFAPEGWVDRMANHHEKWSQDRAKAGKGWEVKIDRKTPPAPIPSIEPQEVGAGEPDSLHRRLATARKVQKLTQAQAGALFGVSQQALGAWEKETKPIPARLRETILRWIETGETPSLP